MDDREIQRRLKILEEIKTFVDNTEKEIRLILQSLGWSEQHIRNEVIKNKVSKRSECPFDASHLPLVSPKKMSEHIKTYKTGRKQYSSCDESFPNNCNYNKNSTVVIDSKLCATIIKKAAESDPSFKTEPHVDLSEDRPIPMSYNEMVSLYTTNERRVLYDYVISKTKTLQRSEILSQIENNVNIETSSHTSHLEELAMLRDMKRRKTKYKVSTKAKSYTEIVREVINNQMKSHCEWVKSTNDHSPKIKSSTERSMSKHKRKSHYSSDDKSKHRKEKR